MQNAPNNAKVQKAVAKEFARNATNIQSKLRLARLRLEPLLTLKFFWRSATSHSAFFCWTESLAQ